MLVRPCSPQVPGLCAAGIRHHACDGCAQRRCAAPARRRPCHACLPSSPRPPERHSCAATHPPVCPPVARSAHADTTPSVFAWQRRPSRWARRRSPRRSPSRSRCVVSASLCHRPAPRSTPMDHQAEPPSLHHRDPRCRATTASCSTTRASRASPATPTPSFTRSASRARAHSTRPTGLISAARLCSARSVPRTAALESSARSSVSCLVLSMCAVAVPSMLNKMDRLKRELLVEFGFDAARKLVRARFERHALLAGSARQRVLSQL